MTKLAIFASGSGSNAENIIRYFEDSSKVEVLLVLTNNKNAGVIDRCQKLNVPVLVFNRNLFRNSNKIVEILQNMGVDWIILAGFLWLVPQNLIRIFPNRIINIHPALLPSYGGKGMWGNHVHEAVIANQEKESGITIHFVNEKYDEGEIIFQAGCPIDETDTAETLAVKIHELEYEYFPRIIDQTLSENSPEI